MSQLPPSQWPRAPVPVIPIAFSSTQAGRPGSVSAAGGLGIAFGVISIIACIGSIGIAAGMMLGSQTKQQRIRQMAPTALPVSTPAQQVSLSVPLSAADAGDHGVGATDRGNIVAMLRRYLNMTPQQEDQLDLLLQKAGRQIFPAGPPATDAELSSALIDHAFLQPEKAGETPPAMIQTAGGKARIYDDRTIFYPADGSPIVRTSIGPHVNASGHPLLRQPDVDALVNLINKTAKGKLNVTQKTTLAQMLISPDQQLVSLNGSAEEPMIGISGASALPGDYVLVGFAGGGLLLSPAGKPVLKNDRLPGVSSFACMLVIAEAVASMGLAVWLILLSNRLLKQRLITTKLHRRWGLIKVVTAMCGAAAFGWMIDSFGAANEANHTSSHAFVMATIVLIGGCTFPALIVILFATQRAKLYFDGVM